MDEQDKRKIGPPPSVDEYRAEQVVGSRLARSLAVAQHLARRDSKKASRYQPKEAKLSTKEYRREHYRVVAIPPDSRVVLAILAMMERRSLSETARLVIMEAGRRLGIPEADAPPPLSAGREAWEQWRRTQAQMLEQRERVARRKIAVPGHGVRAMLGERLPAPSEEPTEAPAEEHFEASSDGTGTVELPAAE